MNRILDRLSEIRSLDLAPDIIDGVPPHRITRLRKEGERLYTGTLRELSAERRLSILVACISQWRSLFADAAIETHERITGKLFSQAKRQQEEMVHEQKISVTRSLQCFAEVGSTLIRARQCGDNPYDALEAMMSWSEFEGAVYNARSLTGKLQTSPIEFLSAGYGLLRRYAPKFLTSFEFHASPAAKPLLAAINILRQMNTENTRHLPANIPVSFVREKWLKHVLPNAQIDRRYWEICVLFELRNALRSGDIWINESLRYRSIEQELLPVPAVSACTQLAVPLQADQWLNTQRTATYGRMKTVSKALKNKTLPFARLQGTKLQLSPLKRSVPDEVNSLAAKLYDLVPRIRITDLLAEVNGWTGFADAFTHLRTGAPPKDHNALLTAVLADGINLGLRRMADACTGYSFWELLRVADWHVREETYDQALAVLIDAQHEQPLSSLWGDGTTSSSDGQHFSAGGHGEAMNVVNAKYGNSPGVSFYTHISDQYGPYHAKVIPATAHEAPHVLDGFLRHESSLEIKEHYTDTGGFTDHVFAVSALLGVRFAPRIRDLSDKNSTRSIRRLLILAWSP